MRWLDFLVSRGINPEDEMPNKEEIEENQAGTEENQTGTGENTKTIEKLMATIESLQKQNAQLIEANKDIALKGTVESNKVPIEEEIKNIMEGM